MKTFHKREKLRKQLLNPILQRLFLLIKLPAAFFMGVRIESINERSVCVSVPYGWRSQNPFRSIYFAAQAAAAEMSTGVPAIMAIQSEQKISMLITDMQATYVKKANRKVLFTCDEVERVIKEIDQMLIDQEPRTITMNSVGIQKDSKGEEAVVSTFAFTWSFKIKN